MKTKYKLILHKIYPPSQYQLYQTLHDIKTKKPSSLPGFCCILVKIHVIFTIQLLSLRDCSLVTETEAPSAPDSSLATLLLRAGFLQERPPSTSPTRSSTPAAGPSPGTTTGSLMARLFKMVPSASWQVTLEVNSSLQNSCSATNSFYSSTTTSYCSRKSVWEITYKLYVIVHCTHVDTYQLTICTTIRHIF